MAAIARLLSELRKRTRYEFHFRSSTHAVRLAFLAAVAPFAFTYHAVKAVTAYVEAERLCCADIRWELDDEPALRLRIGATPGQLDILEQLFTSSDAPV